MFHIYHVPLDFPAQVANMTSTVPESTCSHPNAHHQDLINAVICLETGAFLDHKQLMKIGGPAVMSSQYK